MGMNNFELLMKQINEKGHVRSMKSAVNLSPLQMVPESIQPEVIKGCVAASMSYILKSDTEIKKAFDKVAYDLMMDKIVLELDLKKDENFKPTLQDLFAKTIADELFSQIIKNNNQNKTTKDGK